MDNISKMLQICPSIFEKMINIVFMRFKESNNRLLPNQELSNSITRISLDMDNISKMLQICHSIFEKMINIVFMRFKGSNNSLLHLPDTLKYLAWDYCPLKSLPSNFSPNNLVELRLCGSDIEQLWDIDQDIDLVNLRVMVLDGCKNLRKIPNLLGAKRLETLWCNGCESLVQLPCMTHLVSLKLLHLGGCPITNFPEVEGLIELQQLFLYGTKIEEVPFFVGSLTKLQWFEMTGTDICELNLRVTPNPHMEQVKLVPAGSSSIPSLQCLRRLDVRFCESLERVTFADPGDVDEDHSWVWGEEFLFQDCNKLNEAARDNIIAYGMGRIQSKAKQSAKQLEKDSIDVIHKSNPHSVVFCFPGSEISDKFEYYRNPVTVPGSFSVTLKSDCASGTVSSRFLCFALCIVLHSKEDYPLSGIECNYQLKATDGSSQFFKTRWDPCAEEDARRWYPSAEKDGYFGNGELVYVVFREDMVHRDKDYKEASFSFGPLDYGLEEDWPEEDILLVKKWGIHVFTVDAKSFTVTPVSCTVTFISHEFEDIPHEEDADVENNGNNVEDHATTSKSRFDHPPHKRPRHFH